MTTPSFVHLALHTEFSLHDSLIRVKPLMGVIKEKGMYAVGVSDSTNMFAAIKFYTAAMSKGIKPIISSEVMIGGIDGIGQLTLICQNDDGYKNLTQLISRCYEEGRSNNDVLPMMGTSWMEGKTDGLIVLSGGRNGLIGKALLSANFAKADELVNNLKIMFPNRAYIELQRTGHPDDDRYVTRACELAIKHNIPVVATNAVRFISPEDFKTHEIRAAIAEKMTIDEYRNTRNFLYTPEQYLKTPEEMMELFSDIPSAISNTVAIAQRCNVDILLGKNFLPQFPVPQGMTEASFLESASLSGLEERLDFLYGLNNPDIKNIRKAYDERLAFELNVINQMGFPGYFLIVSDFIQWSKDNYIPVGPGRGSGAGSLVAYALKITDLDPLKYDLLFERFLNPERVSMPDFDVDFCMDRREEVIKYVADKYGHKSVSQIVTFGTMAAKMVVRDVARALGYPYMVGDKISRMIPHKPGTKLQEALEENTDFKMAYENDPEVREVLDHSLKLEGLTRQTGKHAGGVIISPTVLTDYTPTYSEADGSSFVSQFDKNDVELAGLVKFDFLGLRTLTIVDWAINAINAKKLKKGEKPINILSIPMDDEKVFKLLQNADTTAVFQVESNGMKDLLKRLKPDCFEDLIALVALYRPGPLESGMVDNFINRKHGREELAFPDVNYQHESLRGILEPTYGIILYQEQVMQIGQILAGYSLGGADMLRRAMGKKKPEEMAKQRSIFKDGAIKNGVDGDLAMKIFDLVEKFAGYGFNKSHSAAYALISYQTAWLKVHYPAEFMAAVLSSDMDNTEKVVVYIDECRKMGLEIAPPRLNDSEKQFVASDKGEVIYGLKAVKGLGGSAIDEILEERNKNGKFESLYDFCMRCNPNKRMLEAGIYAGVLDGMGPHRAALMESYASAQLIGKQAKKLAELPQHDLFGSVTEDENIIRFKETPEWPEKQRLMGERKTLGLYLTGHPIDENEEELKGIIDGKLAELTETTVEGEIEDEEKEKEKKPFQAKPVVVAGLIMDINVKFGKNGHSAFLVIDDKSRQIDVAVFNKTYNECQHLIQQDTTIIIEGRLQQDRQSGRHKIIAYSIKTLDMVREQKASHIMLDLNPTNMSVEKTEMLKALIARHPEGGCAIRINYTNGAVKKEMPAGSKELKLTDQLVFELDAIFGKGTAKIIYKTHGANSGKNKKQENEENTAQMKEEGEKTRESRHMRISQLLENARLSMC